MDNKHKITNQSQQASVKAQVKIINLQRIVSQVVELSRRLNDPELELDLSQLEQVRKFLRQTGS